MPNQIEDYKGHEIELIDTDKGGYKISSIRGLDFTCLLNKETAIKIAKGIIDRLITL